MTNNADNKSAWDWLHDITNGFIEGQNYVILVPEQADVIRAFDAFREIITAPSVRFHVTTSRIEDTKNHGCIKLFSAANQHLLRGVTRDYKLVDPGGWASNEMRHRFK